jgi:hypothetical protein
MPVIDECAKGRLIEEIAVGWTLSGRAQNGAFSVPSAVRTARACQAGMLAIS